MAQQDSTTRRQALALIERRQRYEEHCWQMQPKPKVAYPEKRGPAWEPFPHLGADYLDDAAIRADTHAVGGPWSRYIVTHRDSPGRACGVSNWAPGHSREGWATPEAAEAHRLAAHGGHPAWRVEKAQPWLPDLPPAEPA